MPDPNGKPGPIIPGGGDKFSNEMRLLLAFALMGVVLFVWQFVYKPPPEPVKPKPVTGVQQPASSEQVKAAAAPMPTGPETSAPAIGEKEQFFTLDNGVYHVILSNRGAVVRSWLLNKYQDDRGKPVDVVYAPAVKVAGYPLSLVPKGSVTADLNNVLWIAKPTPDGFGVDYDFSDGRTVAHKSFRFQKNSYLSEFTTQLTNGGRAVPHLIAWRGGFGDTTIANAPKYQHTVYYDLSNNDLVTKDVGSAKNGPVQSVGNYSFVGIEDSYFAGVFLPRPQRIVEIQTVDNEIDIPPDTKEKRVGALVGGDGQNQFALFVGPKDTDLLARVDPRLSNIISYGWFTVIAKPLFWGLNKVNDLWVHNYGWAIVIVTVILNLALMPFRYTSAKSAKKMSVLQPQVKAIQKKYEGMSIRDPRKAQQQQEMMELYQKHGVNPMGGCLPMIPQFIIFFAFYRVLYSAIEMRGAHWFWITDLSQPEKSWLHILPIIMLVTQFAVQLITPNPAGDPAQQKMMLFMPLVFGFMFYNVSSGLVLYWLTGNIVGIIQQYIFNRAFHVGSGVAASAAVIDATPKKPRRK